jgi:hypothetical protein
MSDLSPLCASNRTPPTRLVYEVTPSPTRTASSQLPMMGYEGFNPSCRRFAPVALPLPRALRQNNPTGKISLLLSGKSLLGLAPSCPRGRGVGHRHRTLGWDAVDAAASGVKCVRRAGFRERTAARRTNGAKAYGKIVWS